MRVFAIILHICLFIFMQVELLELRTLHEEFTHNSVEHNLIEHNILNQEHYKHYELIKNFYENRKSWFTTKLGSLLFQKPEEGVLTSLAAKQKTIIVYIWNKWSVLLTGEDLNPNNHPKLFQGCSVKNCVFTRDSKLLRSADAVLVNIHGGVETPKLEHRNPKQIWILYSFESPMFLFSNFSNKASVMKKYVNLFNWTMTYRSDSDVPIPYGRVVPLAVPLMVDTTHANNALFDLVPYWSYKSHDVLLAVLIANCNMKKRMVFLQNLRKYMRIDDYGNCAFNNNFNANCPGHIGSDCPVLSRYLFYLVLEAATCQEYFTEKVFFYAYAKGAIPVIWGATLDDCLDLLPPNSFIHVDNYTTYKHLVKHIHRISRNEKELIRYHQWRKHFQVTNEHGYFGTKAMQFCRLCEALNYNDNVGQTYNYEDLSLFLDPYESCWENNMMND